MSNSGAKISAPLQAMLFNMLKYGQIAIITGELCAGADHPITNNILLMHLIRSAQKQSTTCKGCTPMRRGKNK